MESLDDPPRVERRKLVTALFCDVAGSTALGEELDPEALHEVMSRYFRELREVIERHGGTVEKFIGDAVMAVFGVPRVREDDALRAVRAAAEIRDRLPTLADEVRMALRFRTGVNTGLVLAEDGENLAIGDAVNVAARLEQAAAPGEIVLGEETLRFVRDAVEVEPLEPLVLKGKSEPVRAFRLLRVDPLAQGLARHLDVPLVGRLRELGLLRDAWDLAAQTWSCHRFTLLGAAGVGKSRLVAELLGQVGADATILQGRCLHYGEGITFWPLVEALSPLGEPARHVLKHLAAGGVATPEELFFEVRLLLESLATERPVILYIDDLQWAESMLLDLLDHVVELSRNAPILLLCAARPELLEQRPAWDDGKLKTTNVVLEPLDAEDCELLLDQLGDGLTADARTRVIATSEGNPLFLEEMVALAREQASVGVPPTIQALLAARLETLPAAERELLERAAIEGEVFHRTSVRALSGELSDSELEARLAGLLRKDLIRPHPPTFQGERAFRFRHLLIRDATYDAAPKAARAQLHLRFASWLEANATELTELDEIAGWHLEQTIRYQHDLRREPDPSLGRRAAQHLHAAGRRADSRSDPAAARSLLERAHALAPENDTFRARIGVDLAEQLIESGDLARVDGLLSVAEQNDDTAGSAQLIRLQWTGWGGTDEERSAAEATLPRLIAELARRGDEHALAKAHLVGVPLNWELGRFGSANEHAHLAAEHARRAGDDGLRSRAIGHFVGGLMAGPASAETMARELEALEPEQLGAYAKAFVQCAHGELARLSGRFAEARMMLLEAIKRFRAMGIYTMAGGCYHFLCWTELQAGRPERALADLQGADALLAELGERGFRSTTQALLASVHMLLGERDAARRAVELAEQLAIRSDAMTYSIAHTVRADLALATGDASGAERWARSAVQFASGMDSPIPRGDAELALARVLHVEANPRAAMTHARTALELFTAKGDQPRVREAGALLDELAWPVDREHPAT